MNDDVSWLQIIAGLLIFVFLFGGLFYLETLTNAELAQQAEQHQLELAQQAEQRQLKRQQCEQERMSKIEALSSALQERHPTWERLLCVEVAKCSFPYTGCEETGPGKYRTGLSESLVMENPDWPWGLIAQKRIRLSMTDDIVRASWGNPSNINRSVGSWGIHEQWIYRLEDAYLYFENGVLTSWQKDL